ncbi:MAG: cytochrome oxidase assembly protein [Rubritepida sp.]|nr:cytochrome oxidase assembly protein [Rubritepida sp.]
MNAAFAHGLAEAPAGAGLDIEPALLPLLIAAVLYAVGSWRLRRRSRDRHHLRELQFWMGMATLALALLSPIHTLGTTIFTLHMVEHELLMVVAAPLLVAARPSAELLWGMPHRARRAFANRAPWLRALWSAATDLWSATILHVAVLWLWHLPGLFRAAIESEPMHILQHVCFLGSALLFWTAVWRAARRHEHVGAAVLALFLTALQAGMLGALLTFARVPWYPFAPDPWPLCGLTRIEDQEMAGLVMWVPACMAYVLVALALMAHWLSAMEPRHAR